MPNHPLLTGMVTVASSSGYWRSFPAPFKYFCASIWYGYVPLMMALKGYVPTRSIGFGEALPRGVSLEWAHWCKHSAYLAREFGRSIEDNYFADIELPFKAYWATDDPIANARSVSPLLELFSKAQIEERILRPAELNVAKIGHHGFFLRQSENTLWPELNRWLIAKATPAEVSLEK